MSNSNTEVIHQLRDSADYYTAVPSRLGVQGYARGAGEPKAEVQMSIDRLGSLGEGLLVFGETDIEEHTAAFEAVPADNPQGMRLLSDPQEYDMRLCFLDSGELDGDDWVAEFGGASFDGVWSVDGVTLSVIR